MSSELLISPPLRYGENQEFETDALRALLNCSVVEVASRLDNAADTSHKQEGEMRNQRTLSWCLVLAMFGALLLTGCATRPLVLTPCIKPLDFVVQQPYGPLTLIPFEDKTPEAEKGRKQFRERLIDVFNDTLLTAIRASQSFKSVVRGTDTRTAEFQLSGVLSSLTTDESGFKFALIPSTMKVSSVCISSVRLVDVMTGTVLLEESVTTTGEGSTRVTGGGQYAQYDSTYGYEESIS